MGAHFEALNQGVLLAPLKTIEMGFCSISSFPVCVYYSVSSTVCVYYSVAQEGEIGDLALILFYASCIFSGSVVKWLYPKEFEEEVMADATAAENMKSEDEKKDILTPQNSLDKGSIDSCVTNEEDDEIDVSEITEEITKQVNKLSRLKAGTDDTVDIISIS